MLELKQMPLMPAYTLRSPSQLLFTGKSRDVTPKVTTVVSLGPKSVT